MEWDRRMAAQDRAMAPLVMEAALARRGMQALQAHGPWARERPSDWTVVLPQGGWGAEAPVPAT